MNLDSKSINHYHSLIQKDNVKTQVCINNVTFGIKIAFTLIIHHIVEGCTQFYAFETYLFIWSGLSEIDLKIAWSKYVKRNTAKDEHETETETLTNFEKKEEKLDVLLNESLRFTVTLLLNSRFSLEWT